MYLNIAGYLKQIKILIQLIKLKIISKITLSKNQIKPRGNILLFHLALENEKKIECKYFRNLPRWFSKKGENVFKIPWFLNNQLSFNNIKTFRKKNFLIFEDYLNIFDYVQIYKIFLKSFSIFNKNIKFKNLNVQYLLKREKLLHLQEPSIYFLRAIPAIKKIAKKVNKITNYDHYENMPFEHPLRFALEIYRSKQLMLDIFILL